MENPTPDIRTRTFALTKIESFLVRSGMSISRLGRESVNDHKVVARLRSGENVTLGVIERVEAFIRRYEAEYAVGIGSAAPLDESSQPPEAAE